MASFLLVDGERNFRQALEIELRIDGAQVTTADAADRVTTAIPLDQFDVCVVDSRVAGADALLERASRAGIPAIAVGPHRELLECAARRHGVAMLEKPFSATTLLALCCELAGRAARRSASSPR